MYHLKTETTFHHQGEPKCRKRTGGNQGYFLADIRQYIESVRSNAIEKDLDMQIYGQSSIHKVAKARQLTLYVRCTNVGKESWQNNVCIESGLYTTQRLT